MRNRVCRLSSALLFFVVWSNIDPLRELNGPASKFRFCRGRQVTLCQFEVCTKIKSNHKSKDHKHIHHLIYHLPLI